MVLECADFNSKRTKTVLAAGPAIHWEFEVKAHSHFMTGKAGKERNRWKGGDMDDEWPGTGLVAAV